MGVPVELTGGRPSGRLKPLPPWEDLRAGEAVTRVYAGSPARSTRVGRLGFSPRTPC